MEDYGSDFITITDEDGNEFELEVLAEVEYQGKTYYAVTPAVPVDAEEEEGELEISLLRSDEEDGEEVLSAIDDEEELNAVYDIVMDSLYDDEEEE